MVSPGVGFQRQAELRSSPLLAGLRSAFIQYIGAQMLKTTSICRRLVAPGFLQGLPPNDLIGKSEFNAGYGSVLTGAARLNLHYQIPH
jgi:hypothetical protein